MKIDILIPTYNRCNFLLANLNLIYNQLTKIEKIDCVKIIISDNSSNDYTEEYITDFKSNHPLLTINYHKNFENIGLKNNITKTLSYATAEYLMFIGDDDFLSLEYLSFILTDYLIDNNIGLVIPTRSTRTPPFEINEEYYTGEKAVLIKKKRNWINKILLSSKCNQLSGVIFFNNSLLKKAIESRLDNLYPFMSFAAWALINKRGILINNNPVLVTEGVKKDWGYGNDGLLIDILDNIKCFEVSILKRVIGEFIYLWIWRDRIAINIVRGYKQTLTGIFQIFNTKRVLFITKLWYILVLFIMLPKLYIAKITGRLISPHVNKKR